MGKYLISASINFLDCWDKHGKRRTLKTRLVLSDSWMEMKTITESSLTICLELTLPSTNTTICNIMKTILPSIIIFSIVAKNDALCYHDSASSGEQPGLQLVL